MRLFRNIVLAALCAAPFMATIPAQPATPAAGSISAGNPQTAWTGGPFLVSTVGAGCNLGSLDPICEHFALTIDPVAGQDVEVSVAVDTAGDVLALSVHAPDGTQVGYSGDLNASKSVVVHAPVAGTYEVRIEPALTINGEGRYQGRAGFVAATDPIDEEAQDCLEPIPAAASPTPVLGETALHADDGRNVNVDIAVLLDGVTQAQAEEAFPVINRAYAPVAVTVRASSFDVVSFTNTGSPDLIQDAKNYFGGTPPVGADLVLVLTAKDIQALGQTAVAGQADCLGGIRYDNRAFMVAELLPNDGVPIGPLTFVKYGSAKVIAHEMGHLFGGQHHYANCAEGIDPETEIDDTGMCTLMYNSADFLSLKFSTLNAVVARGHAWDYARP